MLRVLIDDKGDTWPAGGPELSRYLGYADPDFDLVAYAVRNLGFVDLAWRKETVRVRFRPLIVSAVAMTSAFYVLCDERPRKLVLEYFDEDDWRYEIQDGFVRAIERIERLISRGERVLSYFSREMKISELQDNRASQLAPVLSLWHERGGSFGDAAIEGLKRAGVLGHTIIVDRPPCSERFIFRFHGSEMRLYSREWRASAVGRDIEDQPDPVYAQRIAVNIRRCAMSAMPAYHLLDVVVRDPGSPPRRVIYNRLSLPWHTPDGMAVVTTSAIVRVSELLPH